MYIQKDSVTKKLNYLHELGEEKKFCIIINWTTRYGIAVACTHRTADGKGDILLYKLEVFILKLTVKKKDC